MAFGPGTQVGPFTIVSAIGAGGMGQVYRAIDGRLGRAVAIKILPDGFSTDPDRLMRFDREAKLLASLSHPRIAHVYGLEPLGESHALVMELVDGEDLSARIRRGRIPVAEALAIAAQVAEGVAAAHDHGIIHRDLKPANLKVTDDGSVKVLDFGLAKAVAPGTTAAAGGSTMTSPVLTAHGAILGTAAYMSPEQAKGKPVDKRTDIWAFGCVLFEMLTASRAFAAEDTADTFVAILNKEPDWQALPADTPRAARRLLRRCLEKNPAKRLADLHDARLELTEPTADGVEEPTRAQSSRLPWGVAAAAIVVATVLVVVAWSRPSPSNSDALETWLDVATPQSSYEGSVSLAPDGRTLAFIADSEGRSLLWLRHLGTAAASPLEGTEGALFPFWSPNGQWVGFFAESRLKKIDLSSRAVTVVADALSGRGGAWSPDGTVLFAPVSPGGLVRVSSQGGPVTSVTTPTSPGESHSHPNFLPDGRRFTFLSRSAQTARRTLTLASLSGGAPVELGEADGQALWQPPGILIFMRDGTLLAQRLDLSADRLTGDPVVVVAEVKTAVGGPGAFSVASGTLAFRRGTSFDPSQLTWLDRQGRNLGAVGTVAAQAFPALSPDGSRIAIERNEGDNQDVWILNVRNGSEQRLTFESAIDGRPVWSSDGRWVYYGSLSSGSGLWRVPTTGEALPTSVLKAAAIGSGVSNLFPDNASADGRTLLFRTIGPGTGLDIWLLPLAPGGRPRMVAGTPANETHGQVSPDGRWVAYASDQAGRFEIYIQSAEAGGGHWQVSTGGGVMPKWRPDGGGLLFVALNGGLMETTLRSNGTSIEPSKPTLLFYLSVPPFLLSAPQARNWYEVSPDGRFLTNVRAALPTPITVVLNWAQPFTPR